MPPVLARRKPLPKPSPESDPRFRRVMDQLKAGAAKTKAHPPASKKAAEAAGAAKGPPNERGAAGKAKQVDKIKEAPAKKPEPSSFLDLLRAEIDKAMPRTLGETEKFDDKAQQMKGGLKNSATAQKNDAAGPVAGASRQAPGQEGEAKQETPIPPEGAPAPPNVAAGEGMPAPKSDAEVSLQDSKQDTEQQMKDAEVTPTQLQKANDPRFSAVLDAKGQVAKQADAAPAQYRGNERATLAVAAAGAQNTTRQSAAAMIGVRRGSGTRVLTRQQQQRARDEAKRREVVTNIEKIYNDTKVSVEAKLGSLDTEVSTMFDQGTEAALNAMTTFVNARIRNYKIDRYLSIPIVGAARWIRDQFLGLPSEVNVFYEQGRELFRARMDALIVRVANLVEKRLKEAKDEVARGQAAIKTYVNSLGPELRRIGQQAQSDVAGRFEELTRSIDDKKNQLASSLAAKYKEAFDKANDALKAIQDANTGLVAAFVGKLLEVIKALMEFKDKLMSILRKGAATIKLIIADPIGFLSNLIAAVAGGIRAFANNITAHMVEGFKQWLFGSLGGLGIEIPRDLSLPSILKLVLSVLGITYDRMRAKAVRLIGERNVRLIEKLVEYLRVLINGGPAALWEKLKEDLASLKEMVIDAIKNYIIETAVKRGIAKIVSMFNPVGAIIGAIMAIYDIVMFVVEKAKQIMAFVESVVNSIYDIATGNIGGAIAKVEQSLAKAIPLLLGFLAQFAGLGKITEKIKEFINRIQSKVDVAVDKAIAKMVAFIKRMFGGGGERGQAGPDNRTEQQKQSDLRTALSKANETLADKRLSPARIKASLERVKQQYRLVRLDLVKDSGQQVHVHGAVNPEGDSTVQVVYDVEEIVKDSPADAKAALLKAIEQAREYQTKASQLYTLLKNKGSMKGTKTVSVTAGQSSPLIAFISGYGRPEDVNRDLAQTEGITLSGTWLDVEQFMSRPNARGKTVKELFAKLAGYVPRPDPDRDRTDTTGATVPGSSNLSHSEKRAFVATIGRARAAANAARQAGQAPAPLAISTTRPLCDEDCRPFFKAAAIISGLTIVVGDVLGVYVFKPEPGPALFIPKART